MAEIKASYFQKLDPIVRYRKVENGEKRYKKGLKCIPERINKNTIRVQKNHSGKNHKMYFNLEFGKFRRQKGNIDAGDGGWRLGWRSW